MRKSVVGVTLGLALLGLTACGKNVDIEQTRAQQVQGTRDLWWFCHGTTLIYFERYNGDDEYEAFFAWGCTEDGKLAKGWPESNAEGQGNGEK